MSNLSQINTVNEQSGIIQSFGFDTAPEDMHILYYIARNQLYSDETMALLREYGINAMDIHIATGKAEVPVRITLPTQLDSFLKIRDFGTGLDSEGIKEYAMFGRSSKRGDPLQTGQLGIGCKCGFTYGDSFLVNSYQNGVVTTWNAYIDPTNKGKIDCLAVVPTDEQNGIEVIIPIRPGDIDKCHEKAMFLFSFAKVTPEFVNQTDADRERFNSLKNAAPLFSGEGWRYMGNGTSYAVMGNIPYPINGDNFSDVELRAETKELLDGGIIIDVKMNEVDFAASRENLKYTPMTKKNLSARLTDITNELMKQAATSFDGCKSLWDAKQLYKNIFDFHGKLYSMRHLFAKGLKFNGFPVNSEDFDATIGNSSSTDMICYAYVKPGYGRDTKVRRQVAYHIKASPDSVVVINDTGICNGIMNRIVPVIEGPLLAARNAGTTQPSAKQVYLLSFRDDTMKQKWLAEVGYDGPMISLATLPKEPISKYYPNDIGGTGYHNSKHSSKEFVYNGDSKSRYSVSRSEYWETADVDLAEDEGVYVQIERFYYRSGQGNETHPFDLQKFLNEVKSAGIEVPDEIYGFKPSSVLKAKNNPKMVSLWKWLADALTNHFAAHPEIVQACANRNYVKGELYNTHSGLMEFLKRVAKWKTISTNHPLRELYNKVSILSRSSNTVVEAIMSVSRQLGVVIPVVTPLYNVCDDYRAMEAKYPLLFTISKHISSYALDNEDWSVPMEQYVTLMDTVTP